jgi:membrane fusion protein
VNSTSSQSELPLFRPQVVELQALRLQGEILVGQPFAVRVLTPLLLAVPLVLAAVLATVRIPRTERVMGYVSSSKGISSLEAPRTGVVKSVLVRIGEPVKKGDLLLTISSELPLADGSTLELSVRERLRSEKSELERRLESERALFELSEVRRRDRISTLRELIEGLGRAIALAQERRRIAEQRVDATARLFALEIVSDKQNQEVREGLLRLDAEINDLEISLAQRRAEELEAEREGGSAPIALAARESELRLRILDVSTRLDETAGRSAYPMRAPVGGTVAALQATEGAVVTPGRPIVVLLPEGGRFEAQLLVPTRAAGFVQPGQWVGVRYDAFPYQQFGVHAARVSHVERAVLAPDELNAPISTEEPVYRVIAELERQSVLAHGEEHRLSDGMRLEAEIVLEDRTVVDWILTPLRSIRPTL